MKQLITALMLMICAGAYAQVSVTATAGTSTGTYSTLNAAFAAINAGTHQGTINISITGNTTEPSPPTSLVGSGVGSASYTSIHISPNGGSWTVNSSAVPFAYRGIIELFGAQHVTIDGDPTGTGTRHLTFQAALNSNLSTSVIRLGSTDTTGLHGAAYDTIRNCNLIGGRDSAKSLVANYNIIISGSSTTSISTPLATGCNNNAFINNTFTRAYYAIYLNGVGAITHGNSNTLIRSNFFGSDSAVTSNIYGIYISEFNVPNGTSLVMIDSNDFTAVTDSGLGAYGYVGIFSAYPYGYTRISGNNFHDIRTEGTIYGYFSIGGASVLPIPHASVDFFGNTMQNCINAGDICLMVQEIQTSTFTPIGRVDIYNNTVKNLSSNAATTAGFGLTLNNDSVYLHGNIISNLTGAFGFGIAAGGIIYNNTVTGLTTIDTSGFACGIYASVTAYNNMISNISIVPDSTLYLRLGTISQLWSIVVSPAFPVGAIGMESGGYVYANTIALNTQNQYANAFSAAIYNGSGKLENNIIYNAQNSTKAYGIYAGGSISSDTFDYNEFYVPYGKVGYVSGAQATLLDWQAATSQDLHSVYGAVPFISTSDLHIDTLNTAANNVFRNGTYLSNVTADIDGQSRHNPPCIGADEFTAVNPLPDSLVWPGDADNNRIVDNNDLLPIGLGYDSTGPVRAVTGIVWQADIAHNWSEYFSIYAPTVNFNHADCNGDGIINAADTVAIMANYSLTHAKTGPMLSPWRNGIPAIKAVLTPDTAYNGDTLTVTFVLGDTNTTVNNLYGLAFRYNFDPLVVDSTFPTRMGFLPTSWMGTPSQKISINKIFPTTGQIQAAVTRINHTSASGHGAIATATFKITTDNISGKNYSYYTNKWSITDVIAIDQYGDPILLNAGADSSTVGFYPNGIREVTTETLHIQPNPARDKVMISAGNVIKEISLSNIMGQQVIDNNTANSKSISIDVSGLESGVYVVQVKTDKGTGIEKLIIEK